MSTLTVGRISLTTDPEKLTISAARSGDSRTLALQGSFTGTSLAQLKALRDELAATLSSDNIIPVTWDGDSTVDGFYIPAGGTVDLRSLTTTGSNYGMVEFKGNLAWQGDDNSVRFCSLVTGAVLANDHSYAGSGSGFVGPPINRYGWAPATTGGTVLRNAEDGNIRVILGVASGDNPEWHVAPADYYKAACEVYVSTYVRAGLTAPNDPTDWQIQNSLVKVVPTTDGALLVSHWDSDAWRSTQWDVYYDGSEVGAWEGAVILENRPEKTSVRLVQSRGVQGTLTMDLTLRRGSRFVSGVFYSDVATAAMMLDTDTAGTTTSVPTGTMKKSTVDAYGHRWMVGSEKTTTFNTTNGSMSKTAARLPFLIGKEVDEGGGVQSGDTDDDLWDQYMAWRSERVRQVIP